MVTIGNPAPLGLLAFGTTTALLMYVDMGWIEEDAEAMIYGYAFYYGGLAQLLVAIFELLKGARFLLPSLEVMPAFGWLEQPHLSSRRNSTRS